MEEPYANGMRLIPYIRKVEMCIRDRKKGRDIIYEMVRNCDIVVENFKPGVMEKLGYSYEQLKKVNPGIIYCSISGFGQDSPMRDMPTFDNVAQGLSLIHI